MPPPSTTDCLVLGGGVVGLSLAYQLAGDGIRVRVLERGETGRQASWAGAGILPPGSWFSDHPAMPPVAALSHELNPRWSEELRDLSGIDDEYDMGGAFYAAGPELEPARRTHLEDRLAAWSDIGIAHERCTSERMAAIEPALKPLEAVYVPNEAQVRNPRRLAALAAACGARGVLIETHTPAQSFSTTGDRIDSVATPRGTFAADTVCLAAGAWTGGLGEQIGLSLPTRPIRGQMALLRCPERPFRPVVHWGGTYLVPRRDGRVLVGATVEDVGFDDSTKQELTNELIAFAHQAAPRLAGSEIEATWAGLRPASGDGLPMIGRLPRFSNGWVAAGHYRSGLQFAPATAVAVSQLLRGVEPAFDVTPFDPCRFAIAPVTA